MKEAEALILRDKIAERLKSVDLNYTINESHKPRPKMITFRDIRIRSHDLDIPEKRVAQMDVIESLTELFDEEGVFYETGYSSAEKSVFSIVEASILIEQEKGKR